jgi:hypothetical protein
VHAAGSGQHIEFAFVAVSHDHPFALIAPSEPGRKTSRGPKDPARPIAG